MWCIGLEEQSCSPKYADVLHWGGKLDWLRGWVFTALSFFTCSTLLASSFVSASTSACMHVTPAQRRQQATEAWAHNPLNCYIPSLLHHQHDPLAAMTQKGDTHCSQNCICAARKGSKKAPESCFKHRTYSAAGIMFGAMQCHLNAILHAAALPFELPQDSRLRSFCCQQATLHLFMRYLQHLLKTHSLLVACVRMLTLLLCCVLLHTLWDLGNQHLL